jgi:hypothetical protein
MANSPSKKAVPPGAPKEPEEKLRLLPDPKRKKPKEGFSATGEFTEIHPEDKRRK